MRVSLWLGNRTGADSARCVLVLPGANFPVELPPLALPMRALALDGWTVWCASWDLANLNTEDRQAAISEAMARLDMSTASAPHRLVLAKSLGTYAAAAWAADHNVPAIWLTPLLAEGTCAANIARSTAPALLIGGTRDSAWDDDVAASTGKEILRVDDADHGLQAHSWRGDIEIVRTVTSAIQEFARVHVP